MQIKKETTVQQAFSKLAALCAKGEHCQWDMLQKMRQWGVSDKDQASVMQRLVDGRYVDDERFARAFCADKLHYNKWGRRKIEQALWMKHIDEDIAHRVLDDIDDEEYLAILRPLLRQKERSLKAANDYERRMKLMKFALSRGFTTDIIRQCVGGEELDVCSEE